MTPVNTTLRLPENFEWKPWMKRWDRMQERYLVKRAHRFDLMVQLIAATRSNVRAIVDIGCGTGSLTVQLLESFPEAQILGIEVDPTLLLLAHQRTAPYGERIRLLQRDLRKASWHKDLPPADAVVSATALHWLAEAHLKRLYKQIAAVLADGGLFLNADHVRSAYRPLQRAWERHREEMRRQKWDPRADDWDTFIKEYLDALGDQARTLREQALGPWEGNDDGYPLTWHVEALQTAGFTHVECFWRLDCDVIYGGIREK